MSRMSGSPIPTSTSALPCELVFSTTTQRRFLMRRINLTQSRSAICFLSVCFILLFGVNMVSAQTSNTGTITGVVKDQSGAIVPGASVKLTNLGTNAERTATTTSEGVYEITQLVPGAYRLEVQATGFSKSV